MICSSNFIVWLTKTTILIYDFINAVIQYIKEDN